MALSKARNTRDERYYVQRALVSLKSAQADLELAYTLKTSREREIRDTPTASSATESNTAIANRIRRDAEEANAGAGIISSAANRLKIITQS
jgi:hypothetical protein